MPITAPTPTTVRRILTVLLAGAAALVAAAPAGADTPAAPAVSITTYGPAAAVAGELLTYTFAVANTGGTSFAAADVLVVGSACQTQAVVVNHGADVSTATLDPGDTWTYQCQVQTTAGTAQLLMTGRTAATDASGTATAASSTLTTPLSPARSAVAGVHLRSGSARLALSPRCGASAVITGSRIARATFFVDGRLARRVLRPDAAGRFTMKLPAHHLSRRVHVVRAHVVFDAASRTSPRTLTAHVRGCAAR
ncbi:MAG TPA: hypothetical protein VMT10_02385 [Solirubrobacteraceae bacterium]|nr:hypothetical protein [Solirubrobacteraceae bacterium]